GDDVSVIVTSAAGCDGTSTDINMTVNPAITATLSSSDAHNTICAGESVTFTAAPAGAATYNFRVNGVSAVSSASNTYTTSALASGNIVDVIVTSAAGCVSTSSSITTVVNPLPVASLVSSDADNMICENASVTFTATPSGASLYQFRVNNSVVSASPSNTFTISTLNDGDLVSVIVTSPAGCVGTSADIVMDVYEQVTADAGADQQLCNVPLFTLTGVSPIPATATGLWTFVGPNHG